MSDKTFTKLFNKAANQGLQLGGRASFQEYDLARAVARVIRMYGPAEGIVYLDNYDAQMLLRVGEVTYRPDVQIAMLQPGGGFRFWRVDLAKLHKALD